MEMVDTMTACTNYDRNVRDYAVRRHACGWQLFACNHGPELYCVRPQARARKENPSQLRLYGLACVTLARCDEMLDTLWVLRLKDAQFPRIDPRFDAINEHAQAAFNAALRTVQVEEAYLHCYCVPDFYNSDCEEVR